MEKGLGGEGTIVVEGFAGRKHLGKDRFLAETGDVHDGVCRFLSKQSFPIYLKCIICNRYIVNFAPKNPYGESIGIRISKKKHSKKKLENLQTGEKRRSKKLQKNKNKKKIRRKNNKKKIFWEGKIREGEKFL